MSKDDPADPEIEYPRFAFDEWAHDTGTQWFMAVAALGIGLFFVVFTFVVEYLWVFRMGGAVAILIGVATLWRRRIMVDEPGQTIRVQSRFLNRFRLRERRFPFAHFTAVVLSVPPDSSEGKVVSVYLEKVSGKKLMVRSGSDEGQAGWIARRLAEILRVPLREE